MSNIREEKGYTYGINSQIYNFPPGQRHQHTYRSRPGCVRSHGGRGLQGAGHPAEELVPEEELSLVRNFMIGSILADLDGAFR